MRERMHAVRAWAGLVMVALLLVLAAFSIIERQQRSAADERSIKDRRELAAKQRTVECTIRGVLELSRERAVQRGTLDAESKEAIAAALRPLEDDCPPLVTPSRVDPPPAGGRPTEGGN